MTTASLQLNLAVFEKVETIECIQYVALRERVQCGERTNSTIYRRNGSSATRRMLVQRIGFIKGGARGGAAAVSWERGRQTRPLLPLLPRIALNRAHVRPTSPCRKFGDPLD